MKWPFKSVDGAENQNLLYFPSWVTEYLNKSMTVFWLLTSNARFICFLLHSPIVGRLRPTPHSLQLSLRVRPSPPVPLSPPTVRPVLLVPWSSLHIPRSPCLFSASRRPIKASTIQGRSPHWGFFPPTSTSHTTPRGSLITRSTSLPPPGPSTARCSPRPLPPPPPHQASNSPCVQQRGTGVPPALGAIPAPWTWTTPASSSPSRRGDSWASVGQDGTDTGTTTWHNLGHSWAMALWSSQVFTGWSVGARLCVNLFLAIGIQIECRVIFIILSNYCGPSLWCFQHLFYAVIQRKSSNINILTSLVEGHCVVYIKCSITELFALRFYCPLSSWWICLILSLQSQAIRPSL